MSYHLMSVRMAAIKKFTNNKCWRGCRGKGTLLHCWWECKLVQPLRRTVWRFLKKTGNRTAIWPSNPTPGHTHRGNQNWNRHVYPSAHCSTAYNSQGMEEPRCPSADKWIRKLWYIYTMEYSIQFSSVAQSCLTLCDPMNCSTPSLCPSPTPGVYSNSYPLSRWCHPAISSSVVPFSSCPQSLPAPGSFPMSQPFAWGGQSIGVSASASVLPMNTQDWSPSGWTGWTSLQSKGLSRVFSNTTVQKYQLFAT